MCCDDWHRSEAYKLLAKNLLILRLNANLALPTDSMSAESAATACRLTCMRTVSHKYMQFSTINMCRCSSEGVRARQAALLLLLGEKTLLHAALHAAADALAA